MFARLLGSAVFAALMAGPAAAASFDCGKAQTPLEKIVCANPDLSKADEVMSTAYATALGGLSKPAETSVRGQQRAWLDFVNRACTADAKPATAPYAADDGACLSTFYTSREQALEQSRMLDGLRFYTLDKYGAGLDSDTSNDGDSSPVATLELSYAQIDGTTPEAMAFNGFVRKSLSSDMTGDTLPDGDDDNETLWVTASDSVHITLEDSSSTYEHGAAHGQYGISYLHFMRDQQRALVAGDIFAKKGWQDRLRKLVLDAVKRSQGDDLFEEATQAVHEEAVDPARWDFSPAGLLVQFEPYEVASFAAGPVSVTIPWGALEDDLSDAAQAWVSTSAP
jgi:uncharacterized protein YecT (DUF1311 family)